MADLPIQDIDVGRVLAMAAAQQRKVDEWCQAQGVETEADLAYMYTSHAEALRDAGRAFPFQASKFALENKLIFRVSQTLQSGN